MIPKSDEIRSLLSRYYEGQTSLEEERILHEYFRNESVPEDLDADRTLFLSLENKTEAPAWLKENIKRKIAEKDKPTTLRPRWLASITAAATLAIAVTAGFSLLRSHSTPQSDMTPEEIREMTAMALNKLAITVEKGCDAVETAESKTIETTQKAIKSINSI